jgi:hypothetical protein
MTRTRCFILSAVCLLAVLTLAGCSLPGPTSTITGSGKIDTRNYDVSFFTHINVSSGFKIDVKETDGFSVSISADDNIFPYLDVRKFDNELIIRLKPGSYNNVELRAEVGLNDLRGIRESGGVIGTISGFASSNPMDFDISGGSSLSGQVGIGNSRINLSGGSTLELGGVADDINLNVSGGSKFKGQNSYCTNLNANVSGGSTATVNVTGKLNADVSGASSLTYIGNPKLGTIRTQDVSTIGKP